MSVSIHWRPTSDAGTSFNSGTSDDFHKLEEVFPGNVIPAGVGAMLRAMETASGSKFYGEVADIVEQVGAIEFWGVY
jgi:hypothetical protein